MFAVAVHAIGRGDVAGGDRLEGVDEAIDLRSNVVQAQTDAHQAGRVAFVAMTDLLEPGPGGGGVQAKEVGDVGVRAEATVAHADPVFVPEDRGDESVLEAVDGERDDGHLGSGRIGAGRTVDPQAGRSAQATSSRVTALTVPPPRSSGTAPNPSRRPINAPVPNGA